MFRFADLHQAFDDLGVGEAGVAQDGAAGLDGLDDLVGGVAGECEACGRGVDFHCAAQGLLGAGCHAIVAYGSEVHPIQMPILHRGEVVANNSRLKR